MLGKKIARAMSHAGEGGSESPIDEYGAVVQCVHADTQTIAVLDGYTKFVPLAYRDWRRDEQDDEVNLAYAEHEVLIDIRTLDILEGEMPRRALALILEWAQEHRAELMEDWELCARNQQPHKIRPLA